MKRTFLALVLLVLLGSTLTACGSSSKKTTTTTAAAAGASGFQAAMEAYRSCMAQNGVNLPANSLPGGGRRTGDNGGTAPANSNGTPPPGGGGQYGGGGGARPSTTLPPGVTEVQYQKAQQACASKLPQRGAGGPGGAGGANATQFAAYLSCLSDHGVTVDKTGGPQALANVDRTSATFQAAQTACQALLPQRSTSSSSTSSTTA